MGLISSLAAPSAPQFQSLIVKPVARVAAAPSLGSHNVAQKLAAELPSETAARPILPPASSEAIFKGLLPAQAALTQAAEEVDRDQIETRTEVDGISLDGIPYLRDGAVLLDDLPQSEPEPAPKASPTATDAMAVPTLAPLRPEIVVQAEPESLRADHAERAYLDEREISAVRAEPAAPPAPQAATQSDPAPGDPRASDPPDPVAAPNTAAPSVDKRA